MTLLTSLWKGEGRARSVLAGQSLAGPTSLNREERLLTGLAHDVGVGEGWAGGGGRKEDE